MASDETERGSRSDDSAASDLEARLRSRVQHAYRRVAGAGGLVLVVGIVVWAYGQHLQHVQRDSEIRFVLPMTITMTGAIAAVLGVVLLAAAFVMRARRSA